MIHLANLDRPVLVTGCAGFIGFHLTKRLLIDGIPVFGLDNLNNYYDVSLKNARLKILQEFTSFRFQKQDLIDNDALEKLFLKERFPVVVHLAAQPGVRYSDKNPRAYLDSNLVGFFNILDVSQRFKVSHFVYASSSSVYGLSTRLPFSEHDQADHPVSLYAASKKANELLVHSYSHRFGMPSTGLRFFIAYGSWYRPDMALFKFSRAILTGEPITLHNNGKMQRDYIYIDDLVEGILALLIRPPAPNREWSGNHPDPATSSAPYRVYNIGAGHPVEMSYVLKLLEENIGKKAVVELVSMHPSEVQNTCADITDFTRDTGYQPKVPIEEGIKLFLEWFLDYDGSGRTIPTA